MYRLRFLLSLTLIGIWLHLAAMAGRADVIRYVDDTGKTNYVSDAEKVPEKYKDQISKQKPLPSITKLPAREFDRQLKSSTGEPIDRSQVSGKGGKVQVFVTDWCPYCKKLEAFLKSNKVAYTRYNIERDRKAAQMHQQLGGGGVPVVKIGDQVFHGFDQNQIAAALKLK